MSDNVQTQTVKLEDLNYFWTESGLPCFYADRDNIEDIVEDLGFNIYYLICNIAEDRPINSSTTTINSTAPKYTTDLTAGVVKVVNNIIGRSVNVVSDDILGLRPIRETGEYNMPPIPRIIVDKLDEFFRLVDAQHGTESIVLLTFDPLKNDSSGWGVLVPDQTNTSVHCKYDPDSVVAEKPDNVLIVGSVHSHPKMAAYASGTDHADQADFDGLHITYGWQSTINNGATQYHIEMQMSGSTWTLKPDDVFESFSYNKDPDPDVVEWSSKVKKAYPPHQQAGVHSQAYSQPLSQSTSSRVTTTTMDPGIPDWHNTTPKVNTNVPYIVIAEIDPNTTDPKCPSCFFNITEYATQVGYCQTCDIPFASALDNIDDIIAQAKWYLQTRYMYESYSVYLWSTDSSTKEETMMHIATVSGQNSSAIVEVYSPTVDLIEEEDEYAFDPDLTVCCGTDVFDLSKCRCERPVLYEDIMDFERAHDAKDIYKWDSQCMTCVYYSAPGCLDYVDAVINYATNRKLISSPIVECSSYRHYSALDDDGYPITVSSYKD